MYGAICRQSSDPSGSLAAALLNETKEKKGLHFWWNLGSQILALRFSVPVKN